MVTFLVIGQRQEVGGQRAALIGERFKGQDLTLEVKRVNGGQPVVDGVARGGGGGCLPPLFSSPCPPLAAVKQPSTNLC